MKKKVLFICTQNAARSRMAEAFLNDLGADDFEAYSAGLAPASANPIVVAAMRELGYELAEGKAKSVFQLYREGRLFDYVITVCRESIESECPVFPGITKRLHWGFDDPAALPGSYEERLEGVRKVRDEIKSRIEAWIKEVRKGL